MGPRPPLWEPVDEMMRMILPVPKAGGCPAGSVGVFHPDQSSDFLSTSSLDAGTSLAAPFPVGNHTDLFVGALGDAVDQRRDGAFFGFPDVAAEMFAGRLTAEGETERYSQRR